MKKVNVHTHERAETRVRRAQSTDGDSLDFETLPSLLNYAVSTYDNPNALNYHASHGWTAYSHRELFDRVRKLALGLVDRGVKRGQTIGLVAPSSPEWLIADLAIQIAGAITVPVFNKISPESFKHEIVDSGMRLLFVGDPEEMPKAHDLAGKHVELVSFGYPGTHEAFDELSECGALVNERSHGLFEELCDQIRPSDLATIIYTSGSTGLPKGVELTQQAIVSQVKDAARRFPKDGYPDVCLSILPLAHVFARTVTYFHVASGFPVYFGDDPKQVVSYLQEIRPSIMTVVPRVLEKIYGGVKENLHELPGVKRRIAERALRRAEHRDIDQAARMIDRLYRRAVYAKLADAVGGKLRYVISGSSKLDPKLAQFFINVGVPIYEGYGLTEAAPVISANGPGKRKLGTVGPAFDSVEIRISEEGEILARGPNIMRGYHNNPQATAQVIDSERWLHTGDLGWLDDDRYLTITGRRKELFKKSTGEYVPPVPIEQELEKIPFVDSAVIFADNRVYVTALLFPDLDSLARYKRRHGLADMSEREFLASEFLHTKTQELINAINAHRHHCEWIERFHIVDHQASVESGELTPTLKVRRHHVEEAYHEIIEEMYASIGGTK